METLQQGCPAVIVPLSSDEVESGSTHSSEFYPQCVLQDKEQLIRVRLLAERPLTPGARVCAHVQGMTEVMRCRVASLWSNKIS